MDHINFNMLIVNNCTINQKSFICQKIQFYHKKIIIFITLFSCGRPTTKSYYTTALQCSGWQQYDGSIII
jgi:hypothetical protein